MRFKIRRISKFLLDTHLDFLDADISSKHFVYLQDVFKMFQRHVLKTSSRHVFKLSCRRLQRNIFSSSKTSWRCLEDVFNRSSVVFARRLQDVLDILEDKNGYAEDVLQTSSRHILKTTARRLEDKQVLPGYVHLDVSWPKKQNKKKL